MSEKKRSGKLTGSKPTQKPADGMRSGRARGSSGKAAAAFTDEEKAAMREYAQERKKAARRGGKPDKGEGEKDVLAKIEKMTDPDRSLAQRLHAIIKATAPNLSPKTWYGMPAYANEEGQVVCFFQNAQKFKTRYATLGFSDKAKLDDGNMWPTAFALKELTAGEEARIVELVRKAVS